MNWTDYDYLVVRVAGYFSRRYPYMEYANLIQTGRIGLLDAIERNTTRDPVVFKQYAQMRIAGEIRDELRRMGFLTFREYKQGILVVSSEQVREEVRMIADPGADPFELVDRLTNLDWLNESLGCLTYNERETLIGIYWLDLTQREIAKKLGVTETRIVQLKTMGLIKLKKKWNYDQSVPAKSRRLRI